MTARPVAGVKWCGTGAVSEMTLALACDADKRVRDSQSRYAARWVVVDLSIETRTLSGSCAHNVGDISECGNDSTQWRDGFPLCGEHVARWDALSRIDASQ